MWTYEAQRKRAHFTYALKIEQKGTEKERNEENNNNNSRRSSSNNT